MFLIVFRLLYCRRHGEPRGHRALAARQSRRLGAFPDWRRGRAGALVDAVVHFRCPAHRRRAVRTVCALSQGTRVELPHCQFEGSCTKVALISCSCGRIHILYESRTRRCLPRPYPVAVFTFRIAAKARVKAVRSFALPEIALMCVHHKLSFVKDY